MSPSTSPVLPGSFRAHRNISVCVFPWDTDNSLQTRRLWQNKGIPQKLKHMMNQFIQTPSLIANSAQCITFFKKIEELTIPDLNIFYHYFNEVLGAALSTLNYFELSQRCPPLSSFSDYESLENYLHNKLTSYSQQMSQNPESSNSLDMVKKLCGYALHGRTDTLRLS